MPYYSSGTNHFNESLMEGFKIGYKVLVLPTDCEKNLS